MKVFAAKIKQLKKLSDSLSNRTFSSNFLPALFIAAFIIVAADLATDLASEKDEVGFFLGIIEESCSRIDLSSNLLLNIERPLLYNISFEYTYSKETIDKNSVQDRGPPEII